MARRIRLKKTEPAAKFASGGKERETGGGGDGHHQLLCSLGTRHKTTSNVVKQSLTVVTLRPISIG